MSNATVITINLPPTHHMKDLNKAGWRRFYKLVYDDLKKSIKKGVSDT